MRGFVALAAVAALAVALPSTARANADGPLIQPGAPVQLSGGAFNQPCTLSFVFRDSRHTYIGTVGRCSVGVGDRASMASREFGTVVLHAIEEVGPEDIFDTIDDLTLIQVDDSQLHRVSPQ